MPDMKNNTASFQEKKEKKDALGILEKSSGSSEHHFTFVHLKSVHKLFFKLILL